MVSVERGSVKETPEKDELTRKFDIGNRDDIVVLFSRSWVES